MMEMTGPRYWTCYWREKYWFVNEEYAPVESAGGSFRRRGVSGGDVMYVISQRAGQLLLGGRMTVQEIVPREEAVRRLKNNGLYGADEWVMGQRGSGTPLHHNRQLAPEVTKQLRFKSGQSVKALFFINDRDLDRQTTRIVRELTAESAALLNEIIEMTDGQRSGRLMLITDEHLRSYRRKNPKLQS
jgi:hypothetical protein